MKKLPFFITAFLVSSLSAGITFEFPGDYSNIDSGTGMSGPLAQAINTTPLKFEVMGWRFFSELGWHNFMGDQQAKATLTETDSGYIHEVIFSRPDLYLLPPKGNPNMNVGYNWETFTKSGDATPKHVSVLVKMYEKGVIPLPQDTMKAISPNDIESYTAAHPHYYDSDYRYLDTLGIRGGIYSGGFYDTWNGITQLQIPVPADTFNLSMTDVWFAPQTTGGPIYWMALSMLQEYFHGDMQFQQVIGFKETMAALSSQTDSIPYLSKNSNDDGAFGPFEVESFTYVTGSQYYPQFFPKYAKDLGDAASEFEFGQNLAGDGSAGVKQFTSEYCGPGSGTFLNDPYVIGCMLGSHHTFRRIFDLLSNSTRLCFKEFMEQGKDTYFTRAALGVMYNRGITAPGENSFGNTSLVDSVLDITVYKNYLNNDSANEYIPMGNSLYRHHLLENFKRLEDYSKMAYNDKSIPLFDTWITEEDLKNFFFGAGGTVSTQGEDGLLAHFTIKDRDALWNDIMTAFNTLSAHWNRSTPAISLRYDWLTLLRTVKEYFPVVYKPMPATSEAATWLAGRSLNEGEIGCDGTPIDETYPNKELLGSTISGSEFIAQYKCTDNQAVKKIFWTADPEWNWQNWVDGTNKGNSIYEISVPTNIVSEGDTIWVGVIDSSGNAEISPLTIGTVGTVSINNHQLLQKKKISLTTQGNELTIRNIGNGNVSISIYSLQGRKVYDSQREGAFGVAKFTLPYIAKGNYILNITTKDLSKSIKLLR